MLNKEQKRISRYLCLQAIYAYELAGEQDLETFFNSKTIAVPVLIEHFIEDFTNLFGKLETSQLNYSQILYDASISNKDYVEELIKNKLDNWDISRLSLIDKLILRMSISEMLFIEDVPPKVSITEGVEIAKVFSTKDSSSFVNGILDGIYNNNYKELMKSNKKKNNTKSNSISGCMDIAASNYNPKATIDDGSCKY
jgi:N utilization substance protein B